MRRIIIDIEDSNENKLNDLMDYLSKNLWHFDDTTELDGEISIIWMIEDIEKQAEEMGVNLSEDDCKNILNAMKSRHDATIGINWDVIESNIDDYMKSKGE